MGIRFNCPNGHKLNVKEYLAGKRGVCPQCGAKFTIPEQAEAPQPVGVGQTQSIELAISPAASHPSGSIAASPSVIIPVTDVETASPEVASEPEAILPASIVPVPSLIVAGPAGVAPDAINATPRSRTRRNQILISLMLLALVVLLAGILVWVLQRQVNQLPVEKTAAVDRGESSQRSEMVGSGLSTNAPLRAGATI
jgi:hypothetical protein